MQIYAIMDSCYLENKDKDNWADYCDEKWEKRIKELLMFLT